MEVFNVTAMRLIQYGCLALVAAKEAVDGAAQIEYLSGQRRDTLRG